jgi:2-(1,2-epoxy-1,2-dihydrophenyl)acetyl-CoA isomerase
MPYQTLLFDQSDGVATITLARPDAANALNLTMGRELAEVAVVCDEDPEIRAVLITAGGPIFSAGGDVRAFAGAGDRLPSLLKELTMYLHAALSRFARGDAPTIAAVGGMAAGAGMSLALGCDLVVAGASARFTMAYTRIGLVPDGGSSFHLPRRIGNRRTLELMLTNRVLDANEAEQWGLVNRVVADEDLAAEARRLAVELAAGPTRAFGMARRLVLGSQAESLEAQMELEARAIAAAAATDDGREGIEAFLAKRRPTFRGR